MVETSSIYQRLEASGKRLTPQRELIIKTFLQRPGERLSADEVYQVVHQEFRDVGMATIYRTLDILTQLKIITQVGRNDGRIRYEIDLASASAHQRHHLQCVRCGRLEEFQEDLLSQLEETLRDKRGFVVLDHEVKFYGTCYDCAQKQSKGVK